MRILPTLLLMCLAMDGQTTQGIIRGRIYDAATGTGIAFVQVTCRNLGTDETIEIVSGPFGHYALPSLSPGTWWLRASAAAFQPREAYELELPVAGQLEINIPLRRLSDVYSRDLYLSSYLPSTDAIVHTYAADLKTTQAQPLQLLLPRSGTLQSTLSYMIDPRIVRDLPMSGRDVYTMLVTLPGVTADSATSRGLGLSINGQRASSSNFLLDGVENNDALLTGPQTILAPEAVAEYRVSTNNFSAEFGRSAGFVANAITKSGSNSLHGIVYGYLNDTVLNANSFQHKAGINTSTGRLGEGTIPRQPETQIYAGLSLNGPIKADRTFWSAAYERFRSRSAADPQDIRVPSTEGFRQCFPGSTALQLLTEFAPPLTPFGGSCSSLSSPATVRAPIHLDRQLAIGRVDHLLQRHRLMTRYGVSRIKRPHFQYSVYEDFSSRLGTGSGNLMVGHLWSPVASVINEMRGGWRSDYQGWAPARSDVPALITAGDGNDFFNQAIALPGYFDFPFRYDARVGEWNDTLRMVRDRHVISAGGGFLTIGSSSFLPFRSAGLYQFETLQSFGSGNPFAFQIAADRETLANTPTGPNIAVPRFDRQYRQHQFYLFAQDNLRLSSNAGLNLGIRYESFGAPASTGVRDPVLVPQPGANIVESLTGATILWNPEEQRLFRPDRNNWAGRFGAWWQPFPDEGTVLRAAFGMFYDRPFGSVFGSIQNNSAELAEVRFPGQFPVPRPETLRAQRRLLPHLLWIDGNLRTPYVQSWFGGVQHQFTPNLYTEVSAQGALGRKLIGTDRVNRRAAGAFDQSGRLTDAINDYIVYRSNFTRSNYNAFTSLVRYRAPRVQFQGAYTWSHSIDNQSDPLQGTFEDLPGFRSANVAARDNLASLTQQFDSSLDRASSDFDQRHNLVFFSIVDLPTLRSNTWLQPAFEGWHVAQLAAFRSGFPYNVIVSGDPAVPMCSGTPVTHELVRPRPTLLPGRSPYLPERVPVPGGFKLLDETAFCSPGNALGNLGRNSLTGPGFWNVDLSIAKSFRSDWLGETGIIQFRADFFNVFNHANLGNPNGLLEIGANNTFGYAPLGRQGVQPSFPSLAPLEQLPRQIQLQLRLIF